MRASCRGYPGLVGPAASLRPGRRSRGGLRQRSAGRGHSARAGRAQHHLHPQCAQQIEELRDADGGRVVLDSRDARLPDAKCGAELDLVEPAPNCAASAGARRVVRGDWIG